MITLDHGTRGSRTPVTNYRHVIRVTDEATSLSSRLDPG
jgi:hypothetical protein